MSVYRVARGVIRLPRTKGAAAKSPRLFNTSSDFIKQGGVIPDGLLDQDQIAGMLADGRIELIPQSEVATSNPRPEQRGKWSVDPSALAGKGLEELIVMVMDIDGDYDVEQLKTPADAVGLLTSQWNPAFRTDLVKSNDRSRPEALRHNGVKNAGDKPLSDASADALERAKAAAQARAAGEES